MLINFRRIDDGNYFTTNTTMKNVSSAPRFNLLINTRYIYKAE